jgi:dihydrolipoamide dehydrogenase
LYPVTGFFRKSRFDFVFVSGILQSLILKNACNFGVWKMAERYDVVVIGSGPGGYAAAIRCAQRGASVAVVEKEFIGGTCLNHGCIPSKALLASAHTLLLAKHAKMMGVDIKSPIPNWPKMQARKDAIVTGFRKGLTGLVQSHNVRILQGWAIVTAPKKIEIETDAAPIGIEADRIILATGSQPIEIPMIPFDGQTVISSKEALGLQQIPKSMIIIGGGVIGCELACVYAAVGTKITIVEALSRLIPMEDQWVGRLIEREFKKLGIEAVTNQKVTCAEKTKGSVRVALEGGRTIEAEKVLVSVGRKAVCDQETIEGLGLETNGSAIAVNEKLETNVSGVYAIGDAVGTTYLAHGAFAEAEVAADNAAGGDAKIGDYSLIPRAVYTFPEVASVGKGEDACREKGLEVVVGRAFFKANGRSVGHNETVGEIRVVRDKASDKIMGVTMVGASVTELIAAARALIGSTEKPTEVSFPHPTVSEVLKEAWEDAFDMSLHMPPKTVM